MNSAIIENEHHVDIPSALRTNSPQALQLNLPCGTLLDDENKEKYNKTCLPLYIASMEGDWNVAKDILDGQKELVRYSITRNYETALHVAVSKRNITFVKSLLSLMEAEDLELQDDSSYTALCIAVTNGDVEMAEILIEKNKALITIPTSQGMMPLHIAASSGKNVEMVKFLYGSTQNKQCNSWTHENRSRFLLACVEADYFDVALQVLTDLPDLASNIGLVLRLLAQKPQAFTPSSPPLGSLHGMLFFVRQNPELMNYNNCEALHLLRFILTNITKLPYTEIYNIMRGPADPIEDENTDANQKYSSRVLFLASEVGNIVFIYEVIQKFPEILHEVNDINQSIFHVAVSHRHEQIFGLLYEIGSKKDHIITLEDKDGNNMLHLVGILTESAKSNCDVYIPGAAQKLARELLWFKEVESMLPFSYRKKKNLDGFTPREVFTTNHRYLVNDGEKWMKDTGAQLMLVAALLTTISFAANITFAGGYTHKGSPALMRNKLFQVFIIYNSLAFLFALASMYNVISLLTSRYAEDDFLKVLPQTLMLSIGTLVFSILAMTIAFGFNLCLLYEKSTRTRLPNVVVMITILGVFAISASPMTHLGRYIKRSSFERKYTLSFNRKLMPPVIIKYLP